MTVALMAIVALGVTACGSGSDSDAAPSDSPDVADEVEGDPVAGGALEVAVFAETSGWLPTASIWTQSGYTVARTIFDPLMFYSPSGEIQPYLAESVEATNEDFTEWKITLRDGVDFHDGTPLDADALKIHLTAMAEAPVWGQFMGPVEKVDVTGPLEVTVSMSEPFSTFPHLLSLQPGYVAAPSQYADPDGASNPVGTGPFVFDEWVIDGNLTVTKNADYWREGLPYLDVINFRPLPDSNTRLAALEAGDVDVSEIPDAGTLAALADSGSINLNIQSEGEVSERAVLLNSQAAPFDNLDARLAVAYAIDKTLISETVFEGLFPPANGMFEPSSPWYQDVEFPGYDIDAAEERVTAYKTETGEDLAFTLQVSTDPFSVEQAQLIQQMMGEVGIDMAIESIEATSLLVNGVTGNYQAMSQDLLFGSQNPDREYPILHSVPPDQALSVNLSGLSNADVDAGLEAARTTDDFAAQVEAWKQVQEGLAESSTVLFLLHSQLGVGSQQWVKGLKSTTFPDGSPVLPQTQTIPWLTDVWIDQGG